MINILKRYDLINIKFKFIIIYLLNFSDIIFTLLLLKTGLFVEANIIMRRLVKNEMMSLFVKSGIPLILLFIIYRRLKSASNKQLKIGNVLINCCVITYACINLCHLACITLYFLYQN